MSKAENYQTENLQINGVDVVVISYELHGAFYCKVENKDPGATICREQGTTKAEARQEALAKARERLR